MVTVLSPVTPNVQPLQTSLLCYHFFLCMARCGIGPNIFEAMLDALDLVATPQQG